MTIRYYKSVHYLWATDGNVMEKYYFGFGKWERSAIRELDLIHNASISLSYLPTHFPLPSFCVPSSKKQRLIDAF